MWHQQLLLYMPDLLYNITTQFLIWLQRFNMRKHEAKWIIHSWTQVDWVFFLNCGSSFPKVAILSINTTRTHRMRDSVLSEPQFSNYTQFSISLIKNIWFIYFKSWFPLQRPPDALIFSIQKEASVFVDCVDSADTWDYLHAQTSLARCLLFLAARWRKIKIRAGWFWSWRLFFILISELAVINRRFH